MKNIQPIIGLEVHVELGTKSKMFCGCPAEHFAVEPNTHTCPVCLGLPGALPVPNKKAVEWTILLGLALGCKINEHSKFDRKNYFYPDLSKGYQISQYDEPIAVNGYLEITSRHSGEELATTPESLSVQTKRDAGQASMTKKIRIRRVHLEEDTGKLQHIEGMTLVDFNRSGVPLVEIVTEPDFRSIDEVDAYLKKLQKIIRYLGISGADMEKGSMRLEPSISLAQGEALRMASELPNYRVELKNINSFRFARKALEYEIGRQQKEPHVQQTRGWSEVKNATVPQREKEGESDYRYFPEPDIPPMRFTKESIRRLTDQIPELPDAKSARFQKAFGLSEYSAEILADDKSVAEYFETAANLSKEYVTDIANWIINKKTDITNIVPAQLVQQIISSKQINQVDESELEKIIDQVIAENPKAVEDYKNGNQNVVGFLIGQVSKKTTAADKLQIKSLLAKKIE